MGEIHPLVCNLQSSLFTKFLKGIRVNARRVTKAL